MSVGKTKIVILEAIICDYLNIFIFIKCTKLTLLKEWKVKVNEHELFIGLWASESFQGYIFEHLRVINYIFMAVQKTSKCWQWYNVKMLNHSTLFQQVFWKWAKCHLRIVISNGICLLFSINWIDNLCDSRIHCHPIS